MRARFLCAPGCMAGYEASRLHHLPRTECFSRSGPRALETLSLFPLETRDPWLRQPIWYVTISDHAGAVSPKTWNPRTSKPHIHGIIGGLSPFPDRGYTVSKLVSDLRSLDPTAEIKPVSHAWSWVHYCVSQEKAIKLADGRWDISGKLRHARDVNSYCMALTVPPIESPNLDAVSAFYRQTL